MKPLKLAEVASCIYAHLKRFEADKVINARASKNALTPYYCVNAWAAGSKVGIRYVSFQGESFLSKVEALKYLEWLDAGNIGKHYQIAVRWS